MRERDIGTKGKRVSKDEDKKNDSSRNSVGFSTSKYV
jgi:hypothetical protein